MHKRCILNRKLYSDKQNRRFIIRWGAVSQGEKVGIHSFSSNCNYNMEL